jgi:hypothetical protein
VKRNAALRRANSRIGVVDRVNGLGEVLLITTRLVPWVIWIHSNDQPPPVSKVLPYLVAVGSDNLDPGLLCLGSQTMRQVRVLRREIDRRGLQGL